ncbi:unnamed protein product [Chrysoparadoxa australica]
MAEKVKDLKKWSMSRDVGDNIARAQQALGDQLALVSELVARKIDRSDVGNVEAALAKVTSVCEFLDETDRRVDALEGGMNRAEGKLATHATSLDTLVETAKKINRELEDKTNISNCLKVQREVTDLHALLDSYTQKSGERIGACEEGLGQLTEEVNELGSIAVGRLEALEAEAKTLATKEETDQKADLVLCDGLWGELRHELSCKAWKSDVKNVQEALSLLRDDHARTAKEAGLAIRFVDWFGERGGAYEHNLSAIERKIESLTVDSHPGARTPFSGRVKFTP